nr:S1 RNA-binding domain-containing protein [Streptomyces sp. P9(2023)]
MDHPGGSLLAHLDRVEARLAAWGARDALRLAGLCHAFYGTDGFAEHLLPLAGRDVLAAAIGEEAEELVYFYASCDRDVSYPELGNENGLFRDRFTGGTFTPTEQQRRDFAELTAANELDVLQHNRDLLSRHGGALLKLFTRWRSLLSEAAFAAALELLRLKGAEREAFLTGLERGDVVTGVVSVIASFGVTFVELGGVEAMMNIPEVSWHHIGTPADVIAEGEEHVFEVLGVDMTRERVFLSHKALEPDPLAAFAREGFTGIHAGRVTKVVSIGVFVKVAPGVEGLVHEQDLAGLAPREGDELTVEVASVNLVTRRVGLSLRAKRGA